MQTEFIKTKPQYIPDGYTLESEIDIGGFYQLYYTNKENNSIEYHQEFYYKNIKHINTEGVEYENLLINSYEAIFYNKNGTNMIVFADETYMYTIYGHVSREELIKIAESIKIK